MKVVAVVLLSALLTPVLAAQPLPAPDPDVPTWEHYPFSTQDIERLLTNGEVTLPMASGAALRVQLIALETASATQHLRLRVNGLPGSITRRGEQFFATLPTRSGTLRLESAGGQTRLIDEYWVNQRLLPGLADQRVPR